jgi:hypothetical protein
MKYIIIILMVFFAACSAKPSTSKTAERQKFTEVQTNAAGTGPAIEVKFYGGKSLYYPLMAVWLEDEQGDYIQTMFVPKTIATGIFKYGSDASGKWVEAAKRAPQTLPYWSHKRAIAASDGLYMPEPENPIADAYSGATPTTSFTLTARADGPLPEKFRVMFEINQNWDWNEYWTNDKFPGDENYMMSCQPAIVYEAVIDMQPPQESYRMKPVGHSHYSGMTGELFPDLSTLTTALQIADSIIVKVR